MMLALRRPEPNPTTRPIGEKTPIAEVPLVQVSTSSSEGEDHDIGSESTPHDASKFSHVTEEEMQVAVPEIEPPSMEIATSKGILSFPPWLFLSDR